MDAAIPLQFSRNLRKKMALNRVLWQMRRLFRARGVNIGPNFVRFHSKPIAEF